MAGIIRITTNRLPYFFRMGAWTLENSSGNFCRLSLFLEVLLPYIPQPMRKPLLLFTKLNECMQCIQCPARRLSDIPFKDGAFSESTLDDIQNRLSPFFTEKEKQMFGNLSNMLHMFTLYQNLQAMSSLFSDTAPDFEKTTKDTSDNPCPDDKYEEKTTANNGINTDLLFQMLSPEQKQMLESLKGIMNQSENGGNL